MKVPQHIPMLLGLLLMLVGLGGGIFLVENRTSYFPLASSSATPSDVSIANISDKTATINWLTANPTTGIVKITGGPLIGGASNIGYDIQDEGKSPQSRFVHSINLLDLQPQTTYQFVIVSKNKEYRSDKFTFTTGSILATPEQIIEPAFGMLVDLKNEPVSEALVLASFDGSQNVSAVVKNGSWLLPLGTIRSADNNRYFVPSKRDTEKIAFLHPSAQATVLTTIDNDSPTPPIQLGKAYDFRVQSHRGTIIAQAASPNTTTETVTSSDSFQITSPKKDAGVPSSKPAIKGTGIAGKSVIITISGNNITPISEKESISKYNTWIWVAKSSLSPGEYTITAVSYDKSNKPLLLSQKFTILKSGSAVLQAATPAASLAPIPSPTIVPTPTQVSTSSSIPRSGTTEVTFIFIGLGLLSVFFGISTLYSTNREPQQIQIPNNTLES